MNTTLPSRVIGRISYPHLDAVTKAYKFSPQRLNTLIDRCLVLARRKWSGWRPLGLTIQFHNSKRSMGLSWPRKRPRGKRLISLSTKLLSMPKRDFESVVLHELAHHYTEETRIGAIPRNMHDFQFCSNYRRVNELVKNQRVCKYYFPREQIKHLLGKPGMYTRVGPARRAVRENPTPKLRLPAPPPGGVEVQTARRRCAASMISFTVGCPNPRSRAGKNGS